MVWVLEKLRVKGLVLEELKGVRSLWGDGLGIGRFKIELCSYIKSRDY